MGKISNVQAIEQTDHDGARCVPSILSYITGVQCNEAALGVQHRLK